MAIHIDRVNVTQPVARYPMITMGQQTGHLYYIHHVDNGQAVGVRLFDCQYGPWGPEINHIPHNKPVVLQNKVE